jgi:hypothetical protein
MCSQNPSIARWYLVQMKNLRSSLKNWNESEILLLKMVTMKNKKKMMRQKRNREKERILSLRMKTETHRTQQLNRGEDLKDKVKIRKERANQ